MIKHRPMHGLSSINPPESLASSGPPPSPSPGSFSSLPDSPSSPVILSSETPLSTSTPLSSIAASIPSSPNSVAAGVPSGLHAVEAYPLILATTFSGLHGQKYSFEDYLKLPNGGRDLYHLINGVLYHQLRMPNPAHNDIQSYVKIVVESRNLQKPRHKWLSVFFEADIAIFDEEYDPLQPEENRKIVTCVIADIAIGPYVEATDSRSGKQGKGKRKRSTDKKGKRHSKSAKQDANEDLNKKIRYPPPGKIPMLIIEVVSPSNRLQDICVKVTEYARIGVSQYVVVDREANHVKVFYMEKPSFDHSSDVLDKKRTSPRLANAKTPSGLPIYRYSATFRASEVVKAPVLQDIGLTADMMLRPPATPTEVIASAAKRAAKVGKEKMKKDKRDVIRYLDDTGLDVPSHIRARLETTSSSSSSGLSSAGPSGIHWNEDSTSRKVVSTPPASPPRQRQRK